MANNRKMTDLVQGIVEQLLKDRRHTDLDRHLSPRKAANETAAATDILVPGGELDEASNLPGVAKMINSEANVRMAEYASKIQTGNANLASPPLTFLAPARSSSTDEFKEF